MIIVKIVGGLGNQMFQYALAKSLAARTKAEVKIDISDFETYKLHAYGLEHFDIEKNYASPEEVAALKKYQKKRGRTSIIHNFFVADENKYVVEKFPHFDPGVFEVSDNTYLEGYWQSEKYFTSVASDVRKSFTPKIPLSPAATGLATLMDARETISLHVRRGDYVSNRKVATHMGACDPTYYQKALSTALEGLTEPQVFVFSDDSTWVKETLNLPPRTTFVSDHKLQNWEELLLMSHCRRHIISNSSFSWWGAWLDAKKDPMVIAPTPWFKDPKFENKDIAPPAWARI